MIGLITDIHGSLDRLSAALDALAALGVERIICLGDLVDGEDQAAAVIATIRERGIATVKGNHDVFNAADLDPAQQAWLDGLPLAIDMGDLHFSHVAPAYPRPHATGQLAEAAAVFEATAFRLMFVGHAHTSHVYACRGGVVTEVAVVANAWQVLDPGSRHLISVGAVNGNRDGRDTVRCGVFDEGGMRLRIIELDPGSPGSRR